jgi:hypothetical protein
MFVLKSKKREQGYNPSLVNKGGSMVGYFGALYGAYWLYTLFFAEKSEIKN